jgi:hypothetical protein
MTESFKFINQVTNYRLKELDIKRIQAYLNSMIMDVGLSSPKRIFSGLHISKSQIITIEEASLIVNAALFEISKTLEDGEYKIFTDRFFCCKRNIWIFN